MPHTKARRHEGKRRKFQASWWSVATGSNLRQGSPEEDSRTLNASHEDTKTRRETEKVSGIVVECGYRFQFEAEPRAIQRIGVLEARSEPYSREFKEIRMAIHIKSVPLGLKNMRCGRGIQVGGPRERRCVVYCSVFRIWKVDPARHPVRSIRMRGRS